MANCCCSCADGAADFQSISSCLANGLIPVTKYLSKSTGLTVVHAEVEGPIVSSYICVPTRAVDDDGLPHTLEHLIFLGSEGYPYAGVLDRLANKCLSSGTNAWTDIDHTCFTMSTAGTDGFYNLLPIFVDHILFPLLTDAAFKTEVYHVGGRGNDGGAIYSEILALENTSYSRATETLFGELYPRDSGYRYNVGGKLKNLRDSTNITKVRDFHKSYYHTRNICLIVCGEADPKRMFQALYPVLKKSLLKEKNAQNSPAIIKKVKPWLKDENGNIPDILSPVEKVVQFPCKDEDGSCLISVGLLGPSISKTDLRETWALLILFRYLTKGPSSPLQQEFVEKDSGYLAFSLDFNMVEYNRTAFILEFDGVSLPEKALVVPQLRKILETQLQKFDPLAMQDAIRSCILNDLTLYENAPNGTVADAIIRDFIYGDDDFSKLEQRLNRISSFQSLLQESPSFWITLLQEKILMPNWVAVYSEPSRNLLKDLAKAEEDRINQRRSVLGENGLSVFMHELDEAILLNSKRVPDKFLRKVKVPSMKSIQYHRINRIKNPIWVEEHDFPATLCIDDIDTNFVYLGLLLDTSKLDDNLRRFLPLFKEVLLTSPLKGALNVTKSHYDLIPPDEVNVMRSKILQVCELAFGIELDFRGEGCSSFSCGSYSHLLAMDLQMEVHSAEEGFSWVRKIFWEVEWTLDSIKMAVNKLLDEIQLLQRDGTRLCQMILKHLLYKLNSNVMHCSFLRQYQVLQELGAEDEGKLQKNEKIIKAAFNTILNVIRSPENISLHIAARLKILRDHLDGKGGLGALLKKSFPFPGESTKRRGEREFANMPDTTWMIPLEESVHHRQSKHLNLADFRNSVVFGSAFEVTSCMAMVAPGPTNYLDKDIPALLTTLQYFTQQDGPIYQRIRVSGLSFSYNAVTKVNEGLIYFHLYRCSDFVPAYTIVLSAVRDHLRTNSKRFWNEELLVAAKSSLIFQCLDTEKTPLSRAANSMLDYFRNVSGTYMRELTLKISKINLKEIQKMTKKYLDGLFNTDNYPMVIVCPEEKAENIQKGMEKLGKKMRVVNTMEEL